VSLRMKNGNLGSKSEKNNFHIVKMVLGPGSAHARPSAQPPIDTSGNCSAHMSAFEKNLKKP
jgi:hypothetical protein